MKKNSKIWILLTSIVLILSITVVGTLAFLIDSDEVINTFTVGNVQLKLDEALVDEAGETVAGAGRVTSNEYKLMPGGVYSKDPTVTVLSGSEDAYIRMILTIHNHDAVQAIVDNPRHNLNGDYRGLLVNWADGIWNYETCTVDAAANTISFEFRYWTTVSGHGPNGLDEDVVLEPLFTALAVPGTVNGAELAALMGDNGEDFQIDVVAHAIQSYSFADADEAWAAFDEQLEYENSVAAATTTEDPNTTAAETEPSNDPAEP